MSVEQKVAKEPRVKTAQAWIELRADDPEAASALWVARNRLAVGREMTGLRRFRLIELTGPLPTRPRVEKLLHESTQFYNPHKERCHVRSAPRDAVPVSAEEQLVLVTERGGERRGAAERWWQHETGRSVEVREGIVWALSFAAGPEAKVRAADLVRVRDREHGLFCNPWCQDARTEGGKPPLPWIGASSSSTSVTKGDEAQ
jgi:hypothetical protein